MEEIHSQKILLLLHFRRISQIQGGGGTHCSLDPILPWLLQDLMYSSIFLISGAGELLGSRLAAEAGVAGAQVPS